MNSTYAQNREDTPTGFNSRRLHQFSSVYHRFSGFPDCIQISSVRTGKAKFSITVKQRHTVIKIYRIPGPSAALGKVIPIGFVGVT